MLASRRLARFSRRLFGARLGRVSSLAMQPGTLVRSPWSRARYAVGVSPTSSVNRALNEPSDVQPTAMQTSVTDRSPRRSSALARSIRRVIR